MALRGSPGVAPIGHAPVAFATLPPSIRAGPPQLARPNGAPPAGAGAGVAAPALGLVAGLAAAAAASTRSAVPRRATQLAEAPTKTKRAKEQGPKRRQPPPEFDPAAQIGAVAPLGYFDPLGLCPFGNRGRFRNFREAELKHGRVAMMASVGLVGQHFLKFPMFEGVPAGIRAADVAPGTYGWAAVILLCGFVELNLWKQDPKKEIGDFGDPLGMNMYNEDMRNKEINNGRFAMLSVFEIARNEQFSKMDAVEQFQQLVSKISAQLPGGLSAPQLPAVPVELPAAVAVLPPLPGAS